MPIVNAVSEVYSLTSLHLSEAHWKRNLRQRLGGRLPHDKSLASSLQDYVRTIWSVALVPAGDISWYWEHIVLPAKPQMDNNKESKDISQTVENLLEYVERNFIGRRDREGRYERPEIYPAFSLAPIIGPFRAWKPTILMP